MPPLWSIWESAPSAAATLQLGVSVCSPPDPARHCHKGPQLPLNSKNSKVTGRATLVDAPRPSSFA